MFKGRLKKILAVLIAFAIVFQCADVSVLSAKAEAVNGLIEDIYTDKAMYNPGDEVLVTIELKNTSSTALQGSVKLSPMHLNQKLEGESTASYSVASGKRTTVSMQWKAPDTDFQGYLLEAYVYNEKGELLDTEAVGVNVSSSWVKFPLYGYLHEFGDNVDTEGKIAEMSKYHINGIEYYDWHYRHHEPLPSWSTAENPGTWQDWAGRTTYGETIKDYISAAKDRNMVNMAYDMIYAGTDDFFKENEAANTWKIKYKYGNDAGKEFMFTMGDSPSGNGHLFFVNPLHTDWQIHLFAQLNRMINVMGFDGYHGDTVGDWGDMTDYYGYPLGWDSNGDGIYSVAGTYNSFLNSCKANLPEGAYLTFNPVGAVGIQAVNTSNVDVLYTEFWPWDHSRHDIQYDTYGAIVKEIEDSMNDSKATSIDGKGKSLGVKAYINYRNNGGYINEPTALLMEAACFAAGGYRVEVGNGSHMLTDEYYVNDRLPMRERLKSDVRDMYDFAVGYENLLRDGQYTTNNKVTVNGYSASSDGASDTIWTYTRADEDYQMLHLINLLGTDNKWRDEKREKNAPEYVKNINVKYYYSGDVNSVYLASPDRMDGMTESLSFVKGVDANGKYVEFTVPSLEYWDMIYMSADAAGEVSPEKPDDADCEKYFIDAEHFTGYQEMGTVNDDNPYVSGLNNNTITYVLPKDFKAGQYKMKARYVSAVSADLNITAGGQSSSVNWAVNSSSWSWKDCTDLDCGTFNLKAGDTISMNASGAAPYIQIDYITLVQCDEYKYGNEKFRLEAEEGVLTSVGGSPAVNNNTSASNGQYVHDIGLNQGYVTVKVPEDIEGGLYTLYLVYSSSTNGRAAVTVNGKDYIAEYALTNTSWDYVSDCVSVSDVKLLGGEEISIHDADGNCYIWLDCVAASLDKPVKDMDCQVKFVNGSSEYSSQTVKWGEKAELPKAPSEDGRLFIGWFTENIGTVTAVDGSVLDSAFDVEAEIYDDTVLYAGWLSVGSVSRDASDNVSIGSSESGFYLLGVQYCTYTNADKTLGGIRFMGRISDALISSIEAVNPANRSLMPENSDDTGIGYGMVVTKASNITEGNMLVKDEYAENASKGMKICPAANTYREYDDYLIYTAVVTGIKSRSFDENIAARMYITYVDANGSEQTYYYTETESESKVGGAYYTTYNKVFNAVNG